MIDLMDPELNKNMVKVGSRDSRLALAQVDEIEALLRENGLTLEFERKVYRTKGDNDKATSLTVNTADDFFTDTLDHALRDREIDIAIHSAKDMPQTLREGLNIFALTKSTDETDAFVGKTTFDHLPQGARVATSSFLRQRQVKQFMPHVETVDIRGTIEERIRQMEEGYCEGVIVATVALKRLGLERYIQNIMPWEGTPLQGQLAVVGRKNDARLKELFACIDVRRSYGRVVLVGAGPGDPELFTLKGIRALKNADCVFYDYLIPKEILGYATRAEKIYVGKRKGAQTIPQEELNQRLRRKAVEGKNVVRLKGGDPLIFGRGADEISYLRSYHIEVEVIPGVSSATAVPSHLGIPLTARQIASSVAFVSGYREGEKGGGRGPLDIPRADTLVFLMGLTKLDQIVQALEAAGWPADTPVIVISKGTMPDEKVVSAALKDIQQKVKEESLEPPAIIVAGETVRFWSTDTPRTEYILYTGTNPERFKSLGHFIHFPMIEISAARPEDDRTKTLLTNLAIYDIILFTSRFAVKYFFELLEEQTEGSAPTFSATEGRYAEPTVAAQQVGAPTKPKVPRSESVGTKQNYALAGLREKTFVAIGRETAQALAGHGIHPALTAMTETSQGLFQEMSKRFELRGKKILFPRSSLPNPYLKEKLTQEGSRVDELTVYINTKPAKRPLPKEDIVRILFTSPSTVRNFLEDYGAIPQEWRILSRGPKTSEYLRQAGYSHCQEIEATADLYAEPAVAAEHSAKQVEWKESCPKE